MEYEIIERTIDKKGRFFLSRSSRATCGGPIRTSLIRKSSGITIPHEESEQFHSELKTDMDLERLPSGKFKTNELVLELAILSYKILRMIGQESLGKRNPHLKLEMKVADTGRSSVT